MEQSDYRQSEDSLGSVKVPAKAYYGPQTQRAVENFQISGLRLPRRFIKAQALIKAAAAAAHRKLGDLEPSLAEAIIEAAEEVAEGRWDGEFVVDVYQAGAGTSQNMNANEVIANRALELLGHGRDRKEIVHPNDHVNKGQSTNDTIPTAICISLYEALTGDLDPALDSLYEALKAKAGQFGTVVKSGRTHLQDAVPMRLGQEFDGYAETLAAAAAAIRHAGESLLELGIGGNAVGTGVNLHPDYIDTFLAKLRHRTGIPWRKPASRFAFMQNPSAAFGVSGRLRDLAVHLMKITSDLRLLASGPNTGLAEIKLPAVQPGSSIMPGKVNPVILEMTYMSAAQVIGNDTAVQTAMIGSQLEINVMMPVIAYNMLQSVTLLANTARTLADKCIRGIEADEEQCRYWMNRSLSLVTMLNPIIGYDRAAAIAKRSLSTGRPLKELVLEEGIVSEPEWERLMLEATKER